MTPTTIVEKNESGLMGVLDLVGGLKKERFVEGLLCRRRKPYELALLNENVQQHQHRVNMEVLALSKFSETFIGDFATNNNACFDTARNLFHKIRSTIASLKRVFVKMTPVDRRRLPKGVEAPSVFDKSPLGHAPCQQYLFQWEGFPKEAEELYHALETLFSSCGVALALCHRMIKDERSVRGNIELLRQIYDDSCKQMLDAVKVASHFAVSSRELPKNEMEERRKKAKSKDEFLQKEYHAHDKREMLEFLIIQEVEQARNLGMTETERFFFKHDREKALQVRQVIENFHLVNGAEGHKGKLSSTVIVEFLKWCGVEKSMERQLFLQYFVQETEHLLTPERSGSFIGQDTLRKGNQPGSGCRRRRGRGRR